jgi:hypothetical protein
VNTDPFGHGSGREEDAGVRSRFGNFQCDLGRRKLPVAESIAEYRQRNLVPATAKEPKSARTPYQYKHLFQDRKEKPPTCLP